MEERGLRRPYEMLQTLGLAISSAGPCVEHELVIDVHL
jgi:hypothetical protein